MPNKSTDDFHTYRDVYRDTPPASRCRCMFHYGETPNPWCYDPEQTAINHATIAREQLESYGLVAGA